MYKWAVKPRKRSLVVPRLNLACVRPKVLETDTRSQGGEETSCSTEVLTPPDSDIDGASKSSAHPEDFHVNHEYLRDESEKHRRLASLPASPQQQQQKERVELKEEFHYPHVFRKEFYEHAEQAASKPIAHLAAVVPKAEPDFNYPHIFRKEFYEHVEQTTQASGSATVTARNEQQQQHGEEGSRRRDEDFTIVTEQHPDSEEQRRHEEGCRTPKKCQVHGKDARHQSPYLQEWSKRSSAACLLHNSSPGPSKSPTRSRAQDLVQELFAERKLQIPAFGVGVHSRPSSPLLAPARPVGRLSPSAGADAVGQAAQVKQSAPPSPKITILTPSPHHPSKQPQRHRSYFNPSSKDVEKGSRPERGEGAGRSKQEEETDDTIHSPATLSPSEPGSAGAAIGQVQHECICSRGSSTPSPSPSKSSSESTSHAKPYDPYAHMWEKKAPPVAPWIPEPPVFEKHLPCSIMGRCCKQPYIKYSMEGRTQNAKQAAPQEPAHCLAGAVDPKAASTFVLPPATLVWPTLARTKGSQFRTTLEEPRQDRHYVSSGRYDVLPVPTLLGSVPAMAPAPPLQVQGQGVAQGEKQAQQPCRAAIAAEYLEKMATTECEEFNPRAALRKLAKEKGVSVDKLAQSRSCRKAARAAGFRPRFQQLCPIREPCCFALAPRKVGKQVDERCLALKRRRPALSDLWVLRDRCPQVCATAPIYSRTPPASPIPWGSAREEALVWGQRTASCRAAFCTMAVYDSYRV